MLRCSSRTGAVETDSLGDLPASDQGRHVSQSQGGGPPTAWPWLDTYQPASLPSSIAASPGRGAPVSPPVFPPSLFSYQCFLSKP